MASVLIIEDEPTINMILREILSDEGHQVTAASNGRAGLQILQEGLRPDVVIADLRMPDVSGKVVVETMRKDESLKNIPVIIITGAVYDTEEFPPVGSYQATFSKPFDLLEVISKVEELAQMSKG